MRIPTRLEFSMTSGLPAAIGPLLSVERLGAPIAGELVQRLRRSSEFPAVSDPNDAHEPGLRRFNTFGVAATGRVLFSR